MTSPAVPPAPRHECCASGSETVLFLHGMPTSSRLWDRVIAPMRERFPCLAVDLPGLGSASPLDGGFRRLDQLADHLESIRQQRGIARWNIVGHDAGCAVGIEYAHRYPQHVHRLALVTPSIFPELRPYVLFELLRCPVMGELMAPAVSLCFWHIVMPAAMTRGGTSPGERQAAIRNFRAPFRGIGGAWRLMNLLRWGDPAEVLGAIPHRLPALSAPTLIFHGRSDAAVPPEFAARAAALIPDAELIWLDAGHFLPWNEAPVLAARLSTFFSHAMPVEGTPVFARP